jgi:multidrug efflux pump subunit AcrB
MQQLHQQQASYQERREEWRGKAREGVKKSHKHLVSTLVMLLFLSGFLVVMVGTLRCGGAFLNAGGDTGALAVVQCQSPKTPKWQRTGTKFGKASRRLLFCPF